MGMKVRAAFETYLNSVRRGGRSDVAHPHTHTYFADAFTCTLCIMDGGAQLRELLYKYACSGIDLSTGPNAVTERIHLKAKFRFFLDIDFKAEAVEQYLAAVDADSQANSPEQQRDLFRVLKTIPSRVQDALKSITADETSVNLILATRLPYKLHLYFKDLFVTAVEAKRICALVKEAIKDLPVYDESAVDTSVYTTGLRLIWCHKGRMGSLEKQKSEKELHEKLFGPGSWSPVYEITDQTSWKKKENRTMQDLVDTSILVNSDAALTKFSFGTDQLVEDVKGKGKAIVLKNQTQTQITTPPASSSSSCVRDDSGGDSSSDVSFSVNVRLPLNAISQNAGSPASWDHLLPILTNMGFTGLHLKKPRDNGYNFDADRTCNCVVCNSRVHDSHEWFIMHVVPQLFVVKSYSEHCHGKLVGWDQSKTLRNIISMPTVDADYAELFANAFRNVLFWTLTHRTFMHYNGNVWKGLSMEELKKCLLDTLKGVMERMVYVFNEQRRHLDTSGDAAREVKKLAEANYKNAVLGLQYVKKDKYLRGIIELVKSHLCHPHFEEQLDKNVFLLGTNNGVIDLKTRLLRPGVPEDMLSRTVGYAYVTDDETQKLEFETFINQIYPVAEEREIVQRYLGYSLLGDHREKFLLLLTDKREGYNGKSTLAKMVMHGMGSEYARRGGNGLLYKSDTRHETVNSHSSGLLAYKGYRLAYFEELDPKERFNNQEIKDKNGGNAIVKGRLANAATEEGFTWGTKMILLFNDNNFPQFDFTDPQLIERLLLVEHRSRFYSDPHEFTLHAHEPYTYRATDIDGKMMQWRPYYLHWALQGLERYWAKQFGDIPAVCKLWKTELVNNQDIVQEFLEHHTRDGPEGDSDSVCVTIKDLYDSFAAKYPSEHKQRNGGLGPRKFRSRVETLWKTKVVKEKMIRGVKYHSVFVGKELGEPS